MSERTAVIFNRFSHKSLDVRGGGTNPGAIIQQFGFHGGPDQRWRVQDAGLGPDVNGMTVQRFYILSSNSGQALTAEVSGSVVQSPPDPSPVFAHDFGQLWQLEQLPQASTLDVRLYLIRSTKNGRVLGLRSDSHDDGIEVELDEFDPQNQHNRQKWEVLYKPQVSSLNMNDLIVIFSVRSQKCLDVPGFSQNEINIQQFTYNGGRNQFWAFDNNPLAGPIETTIRPLHVPGMALELRDPNGTAGTPLSDRKLVVQRQRSGDRRQLWTFHNNPNGGDQYLISNALFPFSIFSVSGRTGGATIISGEVLDVVFGFLDNGAQIQVHAPHFGPNQLWEIWVSEPF